MCINRLVQSIHGIFVSHVKKYKINSVTVISSFEINGSMKENESYAESLQVFISATLLVTTNQISPKIYGCKFLCVELESSEDVYE